jgi:hypothetical protein
MRYLVKDEEWLSGMKGNEGDRMPWRELISPKDHFRLRGDEGIIMLCLLKMRGN